MGTTLGFKNQRLKGHLSMRMHVVEAQIEAAKRSHASVRASKQSRLASIDLDDDEDDLASAVGIGGGPVDPFMDERQEREYRRRFSAAALGNTRPGSRGNAGGSADPLAGLRTTASSTQLRVQHAQSTAQMAEMSTKLENVARRWLNMGLVSAFNSWREEATTARATRRLMSKTMQRMLNVRLRKSFRKWKRVTRNGRPWRSAMAKLDKALERLLAYPAWLRARSATKLESNVETLATIVAQYPTFLMRGVGSSGGTLAHMCARNNNAAGIERLRRMSTDPGYLWEIRDKRGRSPLDVAVSLGYQRVADTIFCHSGKFIDRNLNAKQREFVFFQGYAEYEQYHSERKEEKRKKDIKRQNTVRWEKRKRDIRNLFGFAPKVAPDAGEEGDGGEQATAAAS